MPIRIPQIVSQQGLAAQPGPTLDPSGAASIATAPARALAQASETLGKAVADYQRVNQKLTEQDMKLDQQAKLTELKDLLAQEDIKLHEEGVEPDARASTFQQRATQHAQELSGQLRYAASTREFQVDAGKLITVETIKQKYKGLAVKDARTSVEAEAALNEYANRAVLGTEAERIKALGDIEVLTGEMVTKGIWGQEKAGTARAKALANVDEGTILRDYAIPTNRPLVLNKLTRGQYPNLPVDYQLKKAQDLAQQSTAEQRAGETRAQEMMKFGAGVFVAQVIDSYSTGKTEDRMDRETVRRGLERYAGYVSPETQRSLITMVEKPELEGGITDPDTYNALKIRILVNPLGTGPDAVLREPPTKLKATDKAELLKMLQTASKEDDVSNSVPYKKGREQIMILLGGVPTGLPEFLGLPILKPAESATLARTLFDFDKRARTDAYLREPEKLLQLGRDMALTARGVGPRPVTPGQAPALPPSTGAPAPGAPKVDLPKMGDAPKGSKKAVPR